MALKTLRGVEEIGGYKVANMADLAEKHPEFYEESGQMNWKWFEKNIRPTHFIMVRPDVNSLTFTIQNGPIKENGVNGCQVDTLVEAAKLIVEGLNSQYPSDYNERAIKGLNDCLQAFSDRKADREKRGVEGYSKK